MTPCPTCDGTGESQKWKESSGVYHDCPCTVCDGTGKVKEDEPMTEQFDVGEEGRECDACEGTGIDFDTDTECAECAGTGYLPEEEIHGACPGCGEYYYDSGCEHGAGCKTCPECYGRGCELCTPEVQSESADFDKFMDVTLLKESCLHTHNAKTVSPQRQMARNYQENPLGRITYGAKR